MDSASWTPELQRALNYDRKSALQIDNGKTPEWFVELSEFELVRSVGFPVAWEMIKFMLKKCPLF